MHESITENKVVIVDQRFRRTNKGLRVEITAAPIIEDLFKTYSDGRVAQVSLYGRYWKSEPADDVATTALLAYSPCLMPGSVSLDEHYEYTVESIGAPLITGGSVDQQSPGSVSLRPNEIGTRTVNISYLRLRGISEGKVFYVHGVFSTAALKEIAQKTEQAIRRLFQDYIRPVEFTTIVMSRPEGL
jgi:hypothetical protein